MEGEVVLEKHTPPQKKETYSSIPAVYLLSNCKGYQAPLQLGVEELSY